MKYDETASEILRGLGGEANVSRLAHCATRLRFRIVDRDKVDRRAVESAPGVIAVIEGGGQFQVVIGNNVGEAYAEIGRISSLTTAGGGGGSGGVLATAIDLVTSIFTPFLWILAGTGLLKALLAVAVTVRPSFAGTSTHAILYVAGDAVFQFLPVLLAVTAAKRFRANQFTALAIAGALLYSATVAVVPDAGGTTVTLKAFADGGGRLTFLGAPVVMVSYLSAVVPTVLAVYAQSHLERGLHRILPATVRNFLTPLVTVATIVPLTFLAIGPVADYAGRGLSDGVNAAWSLSPAVGGALMGAFWQVFVIFGVHWGFVPVMIQDLSTHGHSLLTGPLFPAVLAQAGAGFAVMLRTRNRPLREVAGPATVSAFLAGITEPVIYGVTLRLKKPFVYACIGGAVGGAIAAAGGTAAEGFVLPGAITLSAAVGVGSFSMLLVGTAAAVVIAFLLTLLLGFDDLAETPSAPSQPAPSAPTPSAPTPSELAPSEPAPSARATGDVVRTRSTALALTTPVAGRVVALSAVPDTLFSSGVLGAGAGVVPSSGRVVAPVDGVVMSAMPHAVGIRGADGVEVLVHVGLDTVQLDGQHFTQRMTQGASVKRGEVVTEFDVEAIVAAGYDPTTVVVVTAAPGYEDVAVTAAGSVAEGRTLLVLVP